MRLQAWRRNPEVGAAVTHKYLSLHSHKLVTQGRCVALGAAVLRPAPPAPSASGKVDSTLYSTNIGCLRPSAKFPRIPKDLGPPLRL